MESVEFLLRNKTPRNHRLIGDKNKLKAGQLQPTEGLRYAREQSKLVRVSHDPEIGNQNAVPIEKGRSVGHFGKRWIMLETRKSKIGVELLISDTGYLYSFKTTFPPTKNNR
jgi:hypothetical protein